MKKASAAILLCLIATGLLIPQTRTKVSGNDRTAAEKRVMERQLSYAVSLERRGDLNSSFLAYNQLIKKHYTDLRILAGFVDLSIKTGKIKECETILKELVKKHEIKKTYSDPADDISTFGIKLLGFISELYFRTGRKAEGYEIISLIDSANTKNTFKKEIEAIAFMRSGYLDEAETIFTDLRKDSKDKNVYSAELYSIYILQGKVEKYTYELIKSAEYKEKAGSDSRIKSDVASFNPKAELFRQFEIDEFKDSILIAVEKMYKNDGSKFTGRILSELYFSSKRYDDAFEILEKSYKEKGNDRPLTDFALKLYNSKEYKKASDFLGLLYRKEKTSMHDELLKIYITCLENSSEYLSVEKIIRETGINNGNLILARMYHNHLGKLTEAGKLYKESLTKNKNLSQYWRDYFKLMIAERRFKDAQNILDTILKENILDIFDPGPFFEIKAFEAELQLLLKNKEKFFSLSEPLINDDFISDSDNDIIKIRKDLEVIGNDDEFLDKYIEVLACSMDIAGGIKTMVFSYETENNPEKKSLILETALRYHIFKNEKSEIVKIAGYINSTGEMNNTYARLIIRFSMQYGKDPDLKDVLISLLRSGIDEEIKAEVREIIREREPS